MISEVETFFYTNKTSIYILFVLYSKYSEIHHFRLKRCARLLENIVLNPDYLICQKRLEKEYINIINVT